MFFPFSILLLFFIFLFFIRYYFSKNILKEENSIKNIGLILDGNRRFAVLKNISKKEAYKIGGEKLLEIVEIAIEENIHSITAYILTIDNFKKRTKDEIETIFSVGLDFFTLKESFFIEKNIKIKIIGNLNEINNSEIKEKIENIAEKTKNGNVLTLNLLFIYDYYDDINTSVKKIAQKVKNNEIKIEEISNELIFENILSREIPFLDLIIRTGQRKRLSGFLPLQSIYSEIFFLDILWPEITASIFKKIIRHSKSKKIIRNFGQ